MRPLRCVDFADRRSDAVVDDDEVVVRIERQVVRIEWALGLSGRADSSSAKTPGTAKQRGRLDSGDEGSDGGERQVNDG